MSSSGTGSSVGGLNDLLDPDYDPHSSSLSKKEDEKKKAAERKLPNDDEDEDEEIDVGGNERDVYRPTSPPLKSTSRKNAAIPAPLLSSASYYSPRRRTRSCAVPDVMKTRDTVTLDDLMKNRILRPGDTLEFSGLGDSIETGILLKDGWIEYGSDKYPDLDSWTLKVFKERKRRKKGIDCWETVSARHHSLSHHRDQFLSMLNNRRTYHEKRKQAKEEERNLASAPSSSKLRHQVPGRARLVQQDPTQSSLEGGGGADTRDEDEDEEVLIDDEPATSPAKIVLPHKKRKLFAKTEPPSSEVQVKAESSSSSSVDLLADLSAPAPLDREATELLTKFSNAASEKSETKAGFTTWMGKKKIDSNKTPSPTDPAQPPSKRVRGGSEADQNMEDAAKTDQEQRQDSMDQTRDVDADQMRDEETQDKEQQTRDSDQTRDEEQTRDDEDGTRDEEQVRDELSHASIEQPPTDDTDRPTLEHATSHQPSFSSASTTATTSSSDTSPYQDKQRNNTQHTTYESSVDLGSFAARLDEHEKETDLMESLTKRTQQNIAKSPPKLDATKPSANPLPEPTPKPSPNPKPTPDIKPTANPKPLPQLASPKPTPTKSTSPIV